MGPYGGSLLSQVKDKAGVSLGLPRGLWVILCRVSDWRNRPTLSPLVPPYTLKNNFCKIVLCCFLGPSWYEKKQKKKNKHFSKVFEMAIWLLRHWKVLIVLIINDFLLFIIIFFQLNDMLFRSGCNLYDFTLLVIFISAQSSELCLATQIASGHP